MEERVGEAFAGGEKLTVVGARLRPGDCAPDFKLDYVDLIDMAVYLARLGDSAGSVRVFSVVNSLELPICRLQTQRWEEFRQALPGDVCLYTISMDLPHSQAHWQISEAIIHQMLSAHRNKQFAMEYGILLKEWRLLQRAVFVIDRNDQIVYVEYVEDQQREPDYQGALDVVWRCAQY